MKYSESASQSGKPKIANKPAVRPASLDGRLADAKNVRLIFFGTEDFSTASLKRLIADGWNIVAVVTKPDAKSGRGQKLTPPLVKTVAAKHKIPVLQPASLPKVVYEIASLEPSHGILAAYGKIIPQTLIDIFPGGIINVHPSLLPKWRGASPIEAAILNGDGQTGISLMRLTAEMDEGPVYDQKSVVLTDEESGPELTSRLAECGASFLSEKLPSIIDGGLAPQPQDASRATYSNLLKKEDGYIDWTQPAEVYERQIRAYLGYPKSSAEINGQRVILTKARTAKNESDGKLVVACQPGWLEVLELVAPSGRTMTGKDFLLGHKN